jgi:membrane-bound lytic murein transglycosylase MltF
MLKLQSLVLGLIAATIYTPQSPATSVPDRSTRSSLNREFHAQVVKPGRKAIPAKQPKIEKLLKTRKYPEVRMESSSNKSECERLHKLDQTGSLPPNIVVSTSIRIGEPLNPKCTTEFKVSAPQPDR